MLETPVSISPWPAALDGIVYKVCYWEVEPQGGAQSHNLKTSRGEETEPALC